MGNQQPNLHTANYAHTCQALDHFSAPKSGPSETDFSAQLNKDKIDMHATRVVEVTAHSQQHREKILQKLRQKAQFSCQHLTKVLQFHQMKSQHFCSEMGKILVLVQKPQTSLYRYLRIHKRRRTLPSEEQLLSVVYCSCVAFQFMLDNQIPLLSTNGGNFGLDDFYLTEEGIVKLQDPELTGEGQFLDQTTSHEQHETESPSKGVAAIVMSLAMLREVDPEQITQEMIGSLQERGFSNKMQRILEKLCERTQPLASTLQSIQTEIQELMENQNNNCGKQIEPKKKIRVTLAKAKDSEENSFNSSSGMETLNDPHDTQLSSTNPLMEINLDKNGMFTFQQKHSAGDSKNGWSSSAAEPLKNINHLFPKERFSKRASLNQSLNNENENLQLSQKLQRILSSKNASNSQHLTRQTSNSEQLVFTQWQSSSKKGEGILFQLEKKMTEDKYREATDPSEMEVCELEGQNSYIMEIMNEGLSKPQTSLCQSQENVSDFY